MDDLKHKLEQWNGKNVTFLKAVYSEYHQQALFFEKLFNWFCQDEKLQVSTSWLIKYHYDNKGSISNDLLQQFFEQLVLPEHWEAQLHLLQLLPKLQIQYSWIPIIEKLVRRGLESPVKFVRAWAIQGLYELSSLEPAFKDELLGRCQLAMETESASIRSKVKKIIRLLED